MNPRFLITMLLCLCLEKSASANDTLKILRTEFDGERCFHVDVAIPAGSRHAVLEVSDSLAPGAIWRPVLAGAIDSRAAWAEFRLPAQESARLFARVRTGADPTLPATELTDPKLCTVTHRSLMDEQTTITFLTSARAKMREWSTLPRPESQAKLIAWAKTSPLVADATVVFPADNVCIRDIDDDVSVLLNRPRGDTLAPGTPTEPREADSFAQVLPINAPARARGVRTAETGPAYSIPDSNRAVVAFSLEAGFPNSSPTAGQWLSSHKYQVDRYDSTTLPQIAAWSGPGRPLGVLFWHAHGCAYPKRDGSVGIGLVTREEASLTSDFLLYELMREKDEIDLAMDSIEQLPLYTITSNFVRNRMKFAPHSLVVLDACYGGEPEIAKAFIDAGAGSYASWDWESGTGSGSACLKIFDRLLGMNAEPPISEPKERSFSLPIIIAWMKQMGYEYDPSPKYAKQKRPNAKFVWYHHQDTPAHILRPSVMRILHEFADTAEPYTKFLIEGDFGTDPGPSQRKVLWGGQPVPVVRWIENDGIVIKPPPSPPSGSIQVVLNKQFQSASNLAPMTEWNVPFTYEVYGKGALHAKMVMNVKFRGDVHGSRGAPEMPVQYLALPFSNLPDCVGTVSGSGSHKPDPSTTVTWSGGSNLSSVDHSASAAGPFLQTITNTGTLDILNGRIDLFSLTAHGNLTETEVVVFHDGTSRTTVNRVDLGFAGFAWPIIPPRIDPRTAALMGETRVLTGDGGTSATLSWPSVIPTAAPHDLTVR